VFPTAGDDFLSRELRKALWGTMRTSHRGAGGEGGGEEGVSALRCELSDNFRRERIAGMVRLEEWSREGFLCR